MISGVIHNGLNYVYFNLPKVMRSIHTIKIIDFKAMQSKEDIASKLANDKEVNTRRNQPKLPKTDREAGKWYKWASIHIPELADRIKDGAQKLVKYLEKK